MTNEKRIIIIGAAVLLLIAVSAVAVGVYKHFGKYAKAETEFVNDTSIVRIPGGEGFDEFDPDAEDDSEADDDWSAAQTESDSEYGIDKPADELIEELKRQREEQGFGTVIHGSAEKNALNNKDNAFYNDFVDDDFIDDDFEEAGETVDASEFEVITITSTGYAENEVLCNTESREEAENVAAQISGTLVSWEHNVATIRIEGSVDELLERLEQQGSSLNLYKNYYY